MTPDAPAMQRVGSATISPDGLYRYDLTRRWEPDARLALWMMLNPSIADDELDDHTIKRCIYYTKRQGLGGLVVVNLFAWRATQPAELRTTADPVGPENERAVRHWLAAPDVEFVVAAWGDRPKGLSAFPVMAWADDAGRTVHCLGRTKSGRPRHPSRLADVEPFVEYR